MGSNGGKNTHTHTHDMTIHSQNDWLLEPTPLLGTVKMSPAVNEKAVKMKGEKKASSFRCSQFKAVYRRLLLKPELHLVYSLCSEQCWNHTAQSTTSRKISVFLTQLASTFLLPPPSSAQTQKQRDLRRKLAEEKRKWFHWPTMPIIITKSQGAVLSLYARFIGENDHHQERVEWCLLFLFLFWVTYLALARHSG